MTRITTKSRYPSAEELYALELQARRLRARALAEAFAASFSGAKSLCSRAISALSNKVVRHA